MQDLMSKTILFLPLKIIIKRVRKGIKFEQFLSGNNLVKFRNTKKSSEYLMMFQHPPISEITAADIIS